MKYNWTTEDFLKQIDLLREMIRNETNPERKLYLEKVLDSTEYIAFENFSSIKKPSESLRQRLYNINSERVSYSRYYSLIQNFYFSLEPLEEQIDQVEDLIIQKLGKDFDIAKITGSYISNDKALSLVSTFYHGFDSSLLPYFNEAFQDRFTALRFDGRIGSKDPKASDGTTTFIDGVRKNFINICKTRSASKIHTLIHEYGHVIKNLYNPERAYSNDDGLFAEVDGIFPELVALEENIGNLDPLFVAFQKYSNLISYYNHADALVLHNIILNVWHDNHCQTKDPFFNALQDDYDIDQDILDEALDTTLFSEGVYILSYMVSMELLHIYKKDKRFALSLYKQFLSIPTDKDVLPFLNKLITLNSTILDEATSIVSDMKLQLKKGGAKHV